MIVHKKYELAFIEYSNPNFDRVTVIPKDFLKINKINEFDELPFNIKLNSFMANSSQPQSINNITNFDQLKYPSYKGIGSEYYISNTREVSGASGERNAPAVDVELFDKKSGSSLGRYILSLWCYPNFVNQIWDMPNLISFNGKNYRVYLRNQREFSLSPSGNEFSIKLLNFIHEKYQGTQTPKDFSSRIRLINSGDKIDRELKIWMNNPLRYAKKTFYQSGYLPEDKGTVLQVVRNDSWMIPYLSCMIVFVGMGAQFFWSMQRSKKERKFMKISFPLISTLLVSLFLFSSFLSKNSSDYDFEGFSSLPIMDEGRVQPIDSFSRNLLTMVSGKSSVLDSNGKKIKSNEWLLDLITGKPQSFDTPFIRITNKDLLASLKLEPKKGKL